MALALVLRNANKIQAGSSQSIVLKVVSVSSRQLSHYPSAFLQNAPSLTLLRPNIATSPEVRAMSSDHSKIWPIEKAVSIGLLVLIPGCVAFPNFVLDNLAAVGAVLHFHWGLEAVVEDYARPVVIGSFLSKATMGLLYLVSATTLGGLIYYNINDIGIGQTIKKFWAIKK